MYPYLYLYLHTHTHTSPGNCIQRDFQINFNFWFNTFHFNFLKEAGSSWIMHWGEFEFSSKLERLSSAAGQSYTTHQDQLELKSIFNIQIYKEYMYNSLIRWPTHTHQDQLESNLNIQLNKEYMYNSLIHMPILYQPPRSTWIKLEYTSIQRMYVPFSHPTRINLNQTKIPKYTKNIQFFHPQAYSYQPRST